MFELAVSLGFLVWLLYFTDFIFSYASLFGFERFFSGYSAWRTQNPKFYFPVYFRESFGGSRFKDWLAKLIGCPFCLITFVSLVSGHHFLFCAAIGSFTFLTLGILYFAFNKSFSE